MSDKKYDTCVYIGRFQPLHAGHVSVIRQGLEIAERLIVLVGSANLPRSYKNPWTFADRSEFIDNSLSEEELNRTSVHPLPDSPYDHAGWVDHVSTRCQPDENVALIGHYKDDSSFYLKDFPDWDLVSVDMVGDYNATDIRKEYFNGSPNLLARYGRPLSWYDLIKEEHDHIEQYRKSWEGTPYPVIFQTVDALITHKYKVLLVRRKDAPGKGLWAMPGGFVNHDETLKEACSRELKEETGISVSSDDFSSMSLYDPVGRSGRGRVITHVFRKHLTLAQPIVAGDDADCVQWVPIVNLRSRTMYDDHYFIIKDILKGEHL